ncbi:MAG: hypothetical protein AAF648_01290 [Pseudomonadota bacterium]
MLRSHTALYRERRLVWLAGLLVLAFCAAIVSVHDRATAASPKYGAALAESVAALTAAPLLSQDRIAVGQLANRAARLPGVTGVTIYGVDEQILAMTAPASQGETFSATIGVDGTTLGYLKLTLDRRYLARSRVPLWLLGGCLVAVLPWLLPLLQRGWAHTEALLAPSLPARAPTDAAWTADDARVAAPPAAASPQQRWDPGSVPNPTPAPALAPDRASAKDPAPPTGAYLVLAHLLNELSLNTAERQTLVADAIGIARGVVARYGGTLQPLSGASLALWFDDDEDQAFRSACAAVLLARALNASHSNGVYRLGLHFAADRSTAVRSAYLTDAALLAAAAGDGQVMLSHAAHQRLRQPQRLSLTPFEHPFGDDFATTLADCERLDAVAEPFASLIARQQHAILGQRDSTPSRSTF